MEIDTVSSEERVTEFVTHESTATIVEYIMWLHELVEAKKPKKSVDTC